MKTKPIINLRWMLAVAGIVLCACGRANNAKDSAEPVSTAPAETSAAAAEATTDPSALVSYQEAVEGDLEIAFLGAVSETRSLEDILERASKKENGSIVSQLNKDRIIYGDHGEASYVYLLVPNTGVDLVIGRYSYHAGEITQAWLDETDALPLIYVETAEHIDPQGMIQYVHHFSDGDSEGFMYTGLTAVPGRLRTDYHMGIADTTVYEDFDSSEIPFYDQMFFDTLYQYDEIRYWIDQGKNLQAMEEMMYDGHAYMVYSMERNDSQPALYAISYDPKRAEKNVICSNDGGMSWQTMAMG